MAPFPELDGYESFDGILSLKFLEDHPFSIDFPSQRIILETPASVAEIQKEAEAVPIYYHAYTDVTLDVFIPLVLNEEGLVSLGNQLYRQSVDSGGPAVDAPLSGGRGSIVGSSLESSNVSLADQFIELIETQRSFQANTRIITSSDTLLAELLSIVR